MVHLHTEPGQYDLTVSAFVVRLGQAEPMLLLHRHRSLGMLMQVGGHVELNETPWQALRREVREETGYAPDQLRVLQPPLRLKDAAGIDIHPQPVCLRSFRFGNLDHFHTDISYALITQDAPRYSVGEGESPVIWLTQGQLLDVPDDQTYEDVRHTAVFILDHLLHEWESIPVAGQGTVLCPTSAFR